MALDASKRNASLEAHPDFSEDLPAQYRPSHSSLLSSLYDADRPAPPPEGSVLSAWGPLLGGRGGIVIPTASEFNRSRNGLLFLASLASSHECPLITLQSHAACSADYHSVSDQLGDKASLVRVDMHHVHSSVRTARWCVLLGSSNIYICVCVCANLHDYCKWQPDLESAKDELTLAHQSSDLGWKRTLGVMLAVRLGWEYVFFVDDDITPYTDGRRTLSAAHLAHAMRAMRADSDLQAVSWPSICMADNGVVGHARPLVGLRQDVFISGSAILLRVTNHMSFFPLNMYNEDWLMMVQLAVGASSHTRVLAQAGGVQQKPYDAFCQERAQREEPGELLGEGMMSLLEDEGPRLYSMSDVHFWARVMKHRRELLHWIIRKRCHGYLITWEETETPLSHDPIVGAMNAALWAQDKVRPEHLQRWAQKWWQDQVHWRAMLLSLSRDAVQKTSETSIVDLLQQPRRAGSPRAAAGACGHQAHL